MQKIIDTFSANSLKLLEKSEKEFLNKYIYNLYFYEKNEKALSGQNFHNLICAYLKNFNTEKIQKSLNDKEFKIWENIKKYLETKKNNFIKTEYPFLIKSKCNNIPFYLTGRFDAIYENNSKYIIYDWKTSNFPKNPENDLQTIVYLYCANKIFKTNDILMRYLSLERLDYYDILYNIENSYISRICDIISKISPFKN